MQEIYKQRFKELFFDQIKYIRFVIVYTNEGNKKYYIKQYYDDIDRNLGVYNSSVNFFSLSYNLIWSKLEDSEFRINNQEIISLISDILKEHYKLNDISISIRYD
jgi:hypothetical protein